MRQPLISISRQRIIRLHEISNALPMILIRLSSQPHELASSRNQVFDGD